LKRIISPLIFLSLFCVAGAGVAAAAQACGPTINGYADNFCLTGVGAGIGLDGIYMSPYTATVNGAINTSVICDDFIDDVSVGETWAVQGYSVANAAMSGNGFFGGTPNSLTGYEEVAWLSEMLLSNPPSASGPISYAIWAVFEPTAVQSWLATDSNTYSAVFGNGTPADPGLLAQAQNAVAALGTPAAAAADFSNVTIYTPISGSQSCCGQPQEFVTVSTAEAPAPAVLAVEFVGLGALLFAFRRRKLATR
jgi:hypothetical protein